MTEDPTTPPPGWTPPESPRFGPPPGSAAPAAPAMRGPVGPAAGPDALPPYAAPPGAPNVRYAPPVVSAGGPPPAPAAYAPGRAPAPGARRPATLGVIALVAGLLAAVGASIAGAVAAFGIGYGAGSEMATRPFTGGFDWALLTPVRDAVLAGEIAFWAGTILGLWALVQGIIAIVRVAGRGFAIAAVVLAALGPIVFFTAVQIALSAGLGAGSGFAG